MFLDSADVRVDKKNLFHSDLTKSELYSKTFLTDHLHRLTILLY